MSLKRHVRTRVTVVRAGDTTTLVSLEGWYGGMLLAPVDTRIIVATAGMSRHDLPDTQLWVLARLTARTAEELDLRAGSPPVSREQRDANCCALGRAANISVLLLNMGVGLIVFNGLNIWRVLVECGSSGRCMGC